MDEKVIVIPGESCRLIISLTAKEKWQRKTEAFFRIYNDHRVVSLQVCLEDIFLALQKEDSDIFRVIRGIMSEDLVVINREKIMEGRVSLTLILKGARCLSGVFAIIALQEAISGLLEGNK